MPLFQNSVVAKYLKTQNKENISEMWNVFKSHFHNPATQENIRNSKEEQYQGGFIIDLFVNVLGYSKNPTPNFNITTEYKNVKDSKKADGAIIVNDVVKAVIELKGTNTTDLNKIEVQAFGYKNNQPECTYVVTSNFEKLRFYIDNAIDHIEFNLFTLTEKDFELLYLCLAFENIKNDVPQKIKKDSVSQEDAITKKLYNDYSLFKRELHQSLVILNPQFDALTLFQKSQKLLDRFLFLFFAEDRQLLPPNSVRLILEQWVKLKDLDAYTPLFDRFKKYFGYLNTGFKGKQYDVYAYNGGLFKVDEVLDTIVIDDDLLYKHTLKLSEYDFDSEVDVNILGHIFENSLNELDEIKAQLEGQEIDKSKTKRKKDGVFYTPKYITKYIVENTVGKLCEEKKAELEIVEDDYITDKKRQKKTIKSLIDKLTEYRNWLLQLTICDPACGSGAFLNQALDFLILEHRYIDELQAKLFGDAMVLSDVEKSILENNLFGVDLNEESVEIAKLSLWLRTAQPNRKLNDLSNNIKCGNSLIDAPEIAGEKAFNWQQEFPQIFAKGGFDVVIGNPPYVNANDIKKNSSESEYKFLKSNFVTAKGTVDLYIHFFEKGLNILNEKGILSYITPNRFLSASYGTALREHIIFNYKLESVIDYSDKNVFPDASTYPVITNITHKIKTPYNILTGKFNDDTKLLISKYFPSSKLNLLDDYILGFLLNDKLTITEKIIEKSTSLANVGKINATSTAKEADDYSVLINESEGYKLINTGTIDPYISTWGYNYLTDKGNKYMNPYLPYNSNIISKNRQTLYSSPKIIISKIGLKCEAFYDKYGAYSSINTNCIHSFEKSFIPEYIICWLSSKLYNYVFECLFDGLRMSGGYLLFSAPNLKNTQIYRASENQQFPFIKKADQMFSLNNELLEVSQKFQRALEREFGLVSLPKKLQDWYLLSFAEFIKELEKKKVKLSLSQKAEWEDYFLQESKKALELKTNIDTTDKEIDQMVYELYGLTEEEIEIVENS
jgi:type I restriction-modification system DNA methylase subunit